MAESTAGSPETGAGGPAGGPPEASLPRRAGPARRERLARRRKALGLTQEDLAFLVEVDRSTVVRWERRETDPQPWIQPRLARALRVSADRLAWLLHDDDGPAGDGPSRDTAPGTGLAGAHDTIAARLVPRQLPAAVPDFTGRRKELAALAEMLDVAGDGAGTVVISAIGGTAGVGKTTLALHWAHQAAGRFPDGQLHVNLRGFDPTGVPATADEAIRGFLDALGVPVERVPLTAEAKSALYRSLLADKRMLVVLDNARNEQQVRPLLPASPGSRVIITSRNQLTGLAVANGAWIISLDVLTRAEAIALLTARIGASRCAAEPEAVAEIAGLCAFLPLALAVTAARAATRPGFPLSALAAELRDTANPLNALEVADQAADVRTVLSWSFRQLSTGAARLFRLLGLNPGPDISVPAAASLAAATEPMVRQRLRELARAHLITEHVSGRYAFHDLLRAYAAEARTADSDTDQDAAVTRLLDHYLHTAYPAASLFGPVFDPTGLELPAPGVTPEHPANLRQALRWFETEHHVLLAAVDLAASSGFDAQAWKLAKAMSTYLIRRAHHQELATIMRTALAAATRLGDIAAQASANRILGNACNRLAEYDQAIRHHDSSLALYERLGDRNGQALVHGSLSMVAEYQGRYTDAIEHATRALLLYRALGDVLGEAKALNAIGWFRAHTEDYEQARLCCRQALTLMTEIGASGVQAHVWDSLGYIEHRRGNLAEAVRCYQRALTFSQEVGDRFDEAVFLTHLGDIHHTAGQLAQAGDAWRQALAVFDDLGHPNADEVRAKLAGIAAES